MPRLYTKASGRIAAAAERAGRRQFAVQVIAGLAAFGLGFWGWLLKAPPQDVNGWLNDFFRTVQLITLHFPTEFDGSLPWQLQIGRLAVPLVAFAASFHVVLGAITRPVRLALLPMARDHVVFFGAPRLADAATRRLVARGHHLVFVHPTVESERLDVLEGLGVTVVAADPFLPSLIGDLGLATARAVVVATGNDVDDANLAILAVDAMAKRPAGGAAPIVAAVFEHDDLADRLAVAVDASARDRAIRFHRLSPDREGLSLELGRHAAAIAAGDDPVHAVVVGLAGGWRQVLSRLIVALQARPDRAPIVTLVLDEREAAAFALWRRARPDLSLVVEIAVLPRIGGRVEDAEALATWAETTPPPRLALVLLDDAEGLAAAFALSRDDAGLRTAAALVLVRQSREDRILSRLAAVNGGPHRDPPIAFGGLLREETLERLLDPATETRPIALHAHYLAESATLGWTSERAVAAWEELPETLRDANRAATDHLPILLAALGRALDGWTPERAAALTPADWDRLARIEHRRWAADRIDRGWSWGERRDDDRRRHPCLVPWERLSEPDRQKDVESVRTLLALPVPDADRRGAPHSGASVDRPIEQRRSGP